MVKYLSKGNWLLVLLLTAVLASKVPEPTCNTPRFNMLDRPISLQETQHFRMDELFSGYNLNITIPSQPDFVGLRPKLVKTAGSSTPLPGLRNYHFSHTGNVWGNTLVTLSEVNGSTIINWGSSASSSEVPDLSNRVILENDTVIKCFDAVWFRTEMIILVDCVNTSRLGIGLNNYFYYINSSTKATLGKVKNDLYVGFTSLVHRKIALHTENGYHYLIRAHLAEYVDEVHRHNTYAQIISVNNPMKPWTIRVMDRTFLHQDKLSITDFEVYLGDIYLLDYHSGVIRFDISKQQTILITGRYRTDSGYTKLGVFSNNMANQFLLVLAHNHSIVEVDWTNQIQPQILTKYSIPDNSDIHDLWVNDQYVVAQINANLTDPQGKQSEYHSTYVLTRGSRTYTHAYVSIPHLTHNSFVDLNRDSDQLLAIDPLGLYIYHLSTPLVTVNPTSKDLLNKELSFVVKGESLNEYDPSHPQVCTFTFRFLVVDPESLVLYPTGLTLPKDYYANYPGQLFIPIDRYVFGSNITYGLYFNKTEENPPTYFFLQQNYTIIDWWDKEPTFFKYSFVRTEQYDSKDETEINVYAQDANNVTHFSRCAVIPYTPEVHCFENTHIPDASHRIVNLTATRFHYYQGVYVHLAAIVYDSFPNEVFIYHVEQGGKMIMAPIMFPEGYEGKIQSIEFLGHFLVVVKRYTKELVIFDMIQCQDYLPNSCQAVHVINSTVASKIGVKYFSPMDVYTSDFHPFVLFVQCLDRVVILDITRNGPILLAEVQSPASKEPGFYKWKMAIAQGELVLVNPPNTIEEHDLDQLYAAGHVPFTRTYPTFGYQIQDKFDLDFSDTGNLVYITGIDKKLPADHNSVIMVYRTGYPAASSFYDVFHINTKQEDLIIDATGSFGDYVTVAYGSIFTMFRQYEIPILVFEDVFGDFNFNLTFTNDPLNRYYYLTRSIIHTANYPEDIIINSTDLNKTDFLSATADADNTSAFYPLDDSTWFNGSVLNYTLTGDDCPECNQKIKVRNHVQEERVLMGVHDMEDYAFSIDGGFIQQFQSIIKMRHNGSIQQFVTLPSVLDGESCLYIEHSWIYDFTLSGCKNEGNGGEVYLYTTFYTASKPFVSGPFYSSAKHITSMHVMEDLMILVDVDENPFSFNREGGVIIYAINHDPFDYQIFDELEFINSDDLSAASDWPGGPCFIGNAHFAFTNQTDLYRLVISELRNGLFVVDFRWVKGRKSVEITKVSFFNLAEELVNIHLPMPNLAFFTAVVINKETYDSTMKYWKTEVIVATSNFHSFLVEFDIDRTGTIAFHKIIRVFYRYGFYENENYIKAFDGYFAIGQRLPTMMHVFPWYSKLVLSVYDTRQRWTFNEATGQQEKGDQYYVQGTDIPISFLLGGYTLREGDVTFDWNFTLTRNRTDPFRQIGLLALHNRDARIWQLSVHQRLAIITEGGIANSQKGFLVARNDYHKVQIPLTLIINGTDGGLSGGIIALIVILSVAAAAGIGYFIFVRFVKAKPPNRESEAEKSLLEREADEDEEEEKDQDDDEDGSEQEEEDDDEEGEEEEEGEKAPLKEQKVSSTEAGESEVRLEGNDGSLNRQTITSVDEQEVRVEPKEAPAPEQEPKGEE